MENRSLAILFLIVFPFLLLHLFTFSQFGVQWDEPAHQHLAQATWEFLQGKTSTIQLQRENLIFYGSWFDLANLFVGSSLHHYLGVVEVDAFHLLIFLSTLLGIGSHFFFTKKLFGGPVAWWSLIFLIFLPRFMAHAHYNPKDIPLATFSVLILFCLFQALTKKQFRWALAAGFALGLALALQVTALTVLLIFTVALIVTTLIKPFPLTKKHLSLALAMLPVAAGIVWLAWPATWLDPLLPFKAVVFFLGHDWQGIVLYLGRLSSAAQVPWHYPFVYLFITTPIVTLVLLTLGISQTFRALNRKQDVLPSALMLAWLLTPLVLAAKPGTLRYDGIRHFLLVAFPLATLAGIGADWLMQRLERGLTQLSTETVRFGFLAVGVGLLAKETLLVHPYGGIYFNELFRLLVPSRIEEQMDFDYWGVSYREGVTWLNQYAVPDATICVPIADHLVRLYSLRSDLKLGCSPTSTYVMFITRKAFLPPGFQEQFSLTQPLFTVNRLSSDLLRIYRL